MTVTPNALPLRLAILADDLTGALDAAAPFAGRGLRVEVALHPGAAAAAVATGAGVVAINCGSREITAEAAQAAVQRAMAALPPGTPLFKKVDSRLKGHIAAELSALTFTRALVAPAIPDFGRVVRDGAVQGFGVAEPIAIAPVLGVHAARCDWPDTVTEADMAAALAASEADLLIGARGLAEAVARRMTGRAAPVVPPVAGAQGVLVVGSRDPITLAQVAALRADRPIRHIPAPNGVFTAGPAEGLTLVQALPGAEAATGPEVAAHLARGLHPALTAGCDTLFLTGGATAEAVLLAMGLDQMQLLGECLPGLPVAQAGRLTIVAKSGGFGGADTLIRVARMMCGAGEA